MLILALLAAIVAVLPLASTLKIGADEDFELSKATLLNRGYHLYTEIWDDQPPLDTFLIAAMVKHGPPSSLLPRLFSTFCSGALLVSVFAIGCRLAGTLAGFLAALMLLASPGYLELSASCMQEIPALAPAIATLAVLVWGNTQKWARTVLIAGVLFGVALQMKLIGVIYLPLTFLILWLGRAEESSAPIAAPQGKAKAPGPSSFIPWRQALLEKRTIVLAAVFSAAAAAAFVALNTITGNPLLLQLKQGWAAHFSAAQSFEYGAPADHPFDWNVIPKNWDTSVPALAGIIMLFRRAKRQPLSLVLLAWLAMTFVVFPTHLPWWSYYYIHNAVPLCLCAAVAVAGVIEFLGERAQKTKAPLIVSGSFAACAAAWMVGRVYLQASSIRTAPRLHSALVLKEILRYKPYAEFLFSDEPIYSFYSGIPMPPRLAMISLKRLWSGDMTPGKLAAEMAQTKPGLILLGNDTRELPFQGLIDNEYRMCYQDTRYRVFVLRSISSKAVY